MQLVRPVAIGSAQLLASNVLEDDYPAWDAATTYAASTPSAPVYVIYAASGRIYESLLGSNTNQNPVTATTYWSDVAPMNKWAMFDGSTSSQTTRTGLIDVTVRPGEAIDTLGLVNIEASSVQVTVTDTVEGVVYDQTISLVDPAGVDDWYEYFFDATAQKVDYALSGLPLYANAQIRVQLTSTGMTKCGALICGRAKDIGATKYNAAVGILDYSIKDTNDWGDAIVVERAYKKTGDFTLSVSAASVDALQALLATFRATPVLYIGSSSYGSTILYGFYKDFAIEIVYPTYSVCSLTIEGLT